MNPTSSPCCCNYDAKLHVGPLAAGHRSAGCGKEHEATPHESVQSRGDVGLGRCQGRGPGHRGHGPQERQLLTTEAVVNPPVLLVNIRGIYNFHAGATVLRKLTCPGSTYLLSWCPNHDQHQGWPSALRGQGDLPREVVAEKSPGCCCRGVFCQ